MNATDQIAAIAASPSWLGRLARRLHLHRLKLSRQLSLVAMLLSMVAITGLALHLPWSYVSEENVADMAARLNTGIVNDISKEVDNLFRTTEEAQQTLFDILTSGVVDAEDASQLNQLFFLFPKGNQNFSWVSFGRPNGDFLGAQRHDDVNFRAVKSTWDAAAKPATRAVDH